MKKIHKPVAKFMAVLLLAISVLPAGAQNRDRNDNRDSRDNQTFYNGVRSGGRDGQYSDPRYNNGQYNNGRYDNRQYNNDRYNNGRYNNGQYDNDHRNKGGIGPGKGALIGGAGGAVLGALFGKGIKGAIIGGAAGAGIGAVIGQAHQNDVNRQYDPR
jgi:hypothetical protein